MEINSFGLNHIYAWGVLFVSALMLIGSFVVLDKADKGKSRRRKIKRIKRWLKQLN